MAAKPRKTMDMWKKKEWYNIIAPKMFESKVVATTPSDKPQRLIGRVIRVPLSDITGNMRQQFTKLWLRVVEIKGNDAITEFDGFEIVRESLRRNVRRGKSMIKTVRNVKTKDGVDLRITAYVFTGHKLDTSKKNAISKVVIDVLDRTSKAAEFKMSVQKHLFGNTVTEIYKAVKQIGSIRRVEIAKCKVLKEKKTAETEEPPEKKVIEKPQEKPEEEKKEKEPEEVAK